VAYRFRSKGIEATNVATHARLRLWANAPVAKLAGRKRVLNVPRDVFDIRDREYQPTLAPLPQHLGIGGGRYRRLVRDQGDEGACTGFAMAAVVNRLMASRGVLFDASPRFLYENAKRYDEWKGDEYEGSSVRGAMKGFLKHGVCPWRALPYLSGQAFDRIPQKALDAALDRPLGAYFRVSTSSINDLQSALSEVGVVLASAQVHRGWDEPEKPARPRGRGRGGASSGRGLARIVWKEAFQQEGGHAFVLAGYTREGFIVQNSWGPRWGTGGFALVSYEDWLVNRMDAWVCQLGVGTVARSIAVSGGGPSSYAGAKVEDADIRGHYLAIRNGTYDDSAPYRSNPTDLADLAGRVATFAKKNGTAQKPAPILLFAHGGLVDENGAAAKTLEFKERFLSKGVYPIHFIWHTGLWETLGDLILGQQRKVGPAEGEARVQGWLKEKVIEAKDEALELFLRLLGGPIWREMKGDALEACHGPGVSEAEAAAGAGGNGPAFALLDAIRGACAAASAPIAWHLMGHSAGSIFHCRLFDWFVRRGVKVRSCSFVAPAVSCAVFRRTLMAGGTSLGTFGLHTMSDADERDDNCAKAYSKSLLYLVSESFEDAENRQLLGLARHVREDHKGGTKHVDAATKTWLEANAELDFRRPRLSDPTLHGSYDDDPQTVDAVLRRIGA
jgi:hypothetical protein